MQPLQLGIRRPVARSLRSPLLRRGCHHDDADDDGGVSSACSLRLRLLVFLPLLQDEHESVMQQKDSEISKLQEKVEEVAKKHDAESDNF